VIGGSICRSCGASLELSVVDLGNSPLCESYVSLERLDYAESFYPLHVRICSECWLAQLPAVVARTEIFDDYAYFSAYSDSWVEHAANYTRMIVARAGLTTTSLVVEVASNDGYLLQHFVPLGIPVLGVEPAANVAAAAEERGVTTVVDYFGVELAEKLVDANGPADLVIGNNVLAQVPDLNDFVEGARILLAQDGVATFEFPHLARLLDGLQYDTIYHEHFSYFSMFSIRAAMAAHGLAIFDVEELPTHGGSLRVYVKHASEVDDAGEAVARVIADEERGGMRKPERYTHFAEEVRESKRALLSLLVDLKRSGQQIVGYGAPGKGNTLLNYCGIRTDFLDYTVDRNPFKQGKFTPGTHIPIHPPTRIAETKPDVILVLPWNLGPEIAAQLAYTKEWNAKLIVPIPKASILGSE
jgi:hypothetical protein